jgi:hypothetical protein
MSRENLKWLNGQGAGEFIGLQTGVREDTLAIPGL